MDENYLGDDNNVADALAAELSYFIEQNDYGVVLATDTAYYTRGEAFSVLAPDFSFIRKEKLVGQASLAQVLNIVPDIVVQVVMPTDDDTAVYDKINEWLNFGVAQVWVVYPDAKHLHIYTPDTADPSIFGMNDVITMHDILPGMTLALRDIFSR